MKKTSLEPAAGATTECIALSAASLAERIRAGDRGAEAELCRRYLAPVTRLLLSLCRDPSQADDCANDAMVTVLLKLRGEGIDHPHKLSSFVYQTARFTLIGQLRKQPRTQLVEDMDTHETAEKTESSVVRDEQRDLVTSLIETLEVERDREVLVRSYLCGESKALVCDALTLTATHFDRVISRARGRLRRAIESEYDDAAEVFAV